MKRGMKSMPKLMKLMREKIFKSKTLLVILTLLVIILIATILDRENDVFHHISYKFNSFDNDVEETNDEEISISEMLHNSEYMSTVEAMEKVQTENFDEMEAYATSHKEQPTEKIEEEPLTSEIIELSDIYAETGSDVNFKCYNLNAESYIWETYDIVQKEWILSEGAVIKKDELNRQVSVFNITANQEQMIRCTINLNNGEKISKIASLFVIPHIAKITVKENCTFNAGSYISSRDIPVKVTYEDGKTDTLTGIYGISFVDTMENKELTTNESGNIVETVTTINTECEYTYIGVEEKELILRYRNKETVYDSKLIVSGKDLIIPEILSVEISDFEVSNVDKPVNVKVSISAEDNETPYPYLEYAFLPKGTNPREKDWNKRMSFEQKITKNGVWKAYCRDSSGNIAIFEKEIIAVDQRKPIIKVSLENAEWCTSNKIIVNAQDELSVLYQFTCPESGEDSGWITRNEYEINKNSTWKIQVKDAAGNISSESITVDNIDNQLPVIKEITEGD